MNTRTLGSLFAIHLSAFIPCGCSEQTQSSLSDSELHHANQIPAWSVTEQHSFWTNELHNLIYEQLAQGKLPYQKINKRFLDSNLLIYEKTKNGITVSLSTNYHWSDKKVGAAAGYVETNNNARVIEIYVPAFMDTFKELRTADVPRWREIFHSHSIIAFMHEVEHARHEPGTTNYVDVEEESRAWAETCRYTIVPLVEEYRCLLHPNEINIYLAWKLSNGDTNSPTWTNAIWKIYGVIAGKSQKSSQ